MTATTRARVELLNPLAGFPLKTKLKLIGVRIVEGVKEDFRDVQYRMNQGQRNAEAAKRAQRLKQFLDANPFGSYSKDDNYADWYAAVMRIKQRRAQMYAKRMKHAEVIS